MKPLSKNIVFKLFFSIALPAGALLAFIPDYSALPAIVSFSYLINHLIAFCILFVLLKGTYPSLAVNRAFILLFAYALGIEAVQYFLPTRSASWRDLGADAAGLLTGYLLMILLNKLSITKDIFTE
ncbi:VanZ family protein [Sulfurimonas sp. HSL3-7]|uniref:VanZ family protein n=1 Tax=Sulfonitrofixus jiaomeiensis TaxID=3131938 RepID=UPI0031F8F4D6